jgi:hypothetical protein
MGEEMEGRVGRVPPLFKALLTTILRGDYRCVYIYTLISLKEIIYVKLSSQMLSYKFEIDALSG